MFTILLIIMLVVLAMFVHYVSAYLYENNIKIVSVLVVFAGVLIGVFIVALIVSNMVDYMADQLNFFYKE
ncbi:hypothetical protein GCM10007358_08980 [Phocicoccus schoeneichii]|uniref:Uncharacterized protein n=1 Tax=Phocicoccus schoeneichii TaxID=1812261 RepID=A0A6V7R6V7_9BACL|nr:hypothetical protein [Jeotgalicoccus schoeneichii]GGH51386.1 hypothetical protein GCM10007358_08980 [Jeotgalicoccus schoeneichii]CAD2072612.1 hypothetical protein JEOSCH030_00334 [Jeotgalicoccus schoeneichii]